MRAATIGALSGVGSASPYAKAMAKKLGHRETRLLTGESLLDSIVKSDALARILTRGIQIHQSADGRLDVRGVADHVLRAMNQPPRNGLVNALAEVLKRGIDVSLINGKLETTDLAAYVLRVMKA